METKKYLVKILSFDDFGHVDTIDLRYDSLKSAKRCISLSFSHCEFDTIFLMDEDRLLMTVNNYISKGGILNE